MKDKTSIQISTEIRNRLKEYCESEGYKMSALVEKLILKEIDDE
jgi:predicted DNA-binding protein